MPLKAKLLAFVTAPSRRSIALIYVLFGVLWISVNAGLSSVLFANSTLAAYIGNLVDLMFIVLSGCILYFFIGRAATTPTTPIQRLRLRSPHIRCMDAPNTYVWPRSKFRLKSRGTSPILEHWTNKDRMQTVVSSFFRTRMPST